LTVEVIFIFKDRVIFRQCVPKNRQQSGIKIYKLCDNVTILGILTAWQFTMIRMQSLPLEIWWQHIPLLEIWLTKPKDNFWKHKRRGKWTPAAQYHPTEKTCSLTSEHRNWNRRGLIYKNNGKINWNYVEGQTRNLHADQHQPTCSGGKFVMIRKNAPKRTIVQWGMSIKATEWPTGIWQAEPELQLEALKKFKS